MKASDPENERFTSCPSLAQGLHFSFSLFPPFSFLPRHTAPSTTNDFLFRSLFPSAAAAAAARRARCLPRSSMLGRACHRHRGRPSVRPSVRPKPLLLLTPAPLALSLPLPPALCPSPLRRRPPSLSFALLLQHERWTQRRRGRQRQTVQCSGSVK